MSESTMRDRALAIAALGFRVFRLRPESKLPAHEKFYDSATADPQRVAELWTEAITEDSTANNIGILCGNGLLVLDLDTKAGKQGEASLAALEDLGLDTATLTAESPTGSRHLFYATPPDADVRNSAGRLGNGLDVRGHHGFVVAAGSVLPNGEYRWLNAGTPIAPAPDWLIRMCAPRGPRDADPHIAVEDSEAFTRAAEWLENNAPEALEGAGGNDTTFRIACRLKDFGVDQPSALDLLLGHWNETKALPPWSPEELETLVGNAYRYGASAPGIASAQADFSDVSALIGATPAPEPPAKRPRLYAVWPDEAVRRATEQRVEPLIKGLLDTRSLSAIYGDSNTGKTFVAMDMALHVAKGLPWAGRKTAAGFVVYLAAEGGAGSFKRVKAWHDEHGLDPAQTKFALIPCPVDLRSTEGDTKALVGLIRQEEKRAGESTTLLVVDTLSRALAGGDENSSVDMGGFIRNVDAMRSALGCHLMLVHHTGKNAAKGARGWSGLRAAIDTEMEIADRELSITKQRDLEPIAGIRFALEARRVGVDGEGEPLTTCTVRLLAADEFDAIALSPAEEKLLAALSAEAEDRQLSNDKFGWELVSEAAKRPEFDSCHSSGRNALNLHMTALTEKGAVKKVSRGQWVICNDRNDRK